MKNKHTISYTSSILSAILFVMLPYFLPAQFVGKDWSTTIGGVSSESFHDALELSNGQIVSVGVADSGKKGGKDGLVVISDFFTGETVNKVFVGGKKEDVIQKVIQHWDGTLLLAGHTASKGKSSQEAWLMNMDMNGNVLWEKTFGSTKSDAFTAIGITKTGKIAVAGKICLLYTSDLPTICSV